MPTPDRRVLSAGQARLWFLERLNGASGLYNEHLCVRLTGDLNIAALVQAFAEVARRHESLRWAIRDEGGRCVATPREVDSREWWQTIDLQAVADEPQREQLYHRCATESARQPFDLGRGPLVRILLFRFAPRTAAIAIVMHHIISDSWSVQILVQDLCEAYRALTIGRPVALDEVDYAEDVVSAAECGPDAEAHLRYWTERLADAPPSVSLPTHRPRPDTRSFAGAKHYFTLDERAAAALRTWTRDAHMTPFMVLFALWSAYLGMSTGARDLVIGTTTAGRHGRAAERRIGFFANTLPIRAAVRAWQPFADHLREIRTILLQALDHQAIPFERVVRALPLSRARNRQPLVDMMFIWVNSVVSSLTLPGVDARLTPEDIAIGLCKYDLVLSFCERDGAVQGLIDYSAELYDAPEIGAHMARFQQFMLAALTNPDRPMRDLMPIAAAPSALVDDLRGWSRQMRTPV